MGKNTITIPQPAYEYLKKLSKISSRNMTDILTHALLAIGTIPGLEEDRDFLLLHESNKRKRNHMRNLSSAFFASDEFEKRILKCARIDIYRFGNIDLLKTKTYIRAWKDFYSSLPDPFKVILANDDKHISALSSPDFIFSMVAELEKMKDSVKLADARRDRRAYPWILEREERRKKEKEEREKNEKRTDSSGHP